ncbi:MAG: cell wall hydrolase [Pseudomonadota bacterium]
MRNARRSILACFMVALIAGCTNTATEQVEEEQSRADVDPQDVACLAEAIYFEARGTGEVGTQAVAHVVINRKESPKFPNTVCSVVGDRCQFSYRCDGIPEVYAEPVAKADAIRMAETVLSGAPDITEGSLFFHAAWMEPGWFNTRPRVGRFGGNIFYR